MSNTSLDSSDLSTPLADPDIAQGWTESSEGSLSLVGRATGQVTSQRDLKLVYRVLRLISDCALAGFFSEVCIAGSQCVNAEGPLILTPCHHNEIIDIAALSATIPHRRIIAYWTKASLFENPISRFILRSAGSIPVARNHTHTQREPQKITGSDNSTLKAGKGDRNAGEGKQALFNVTYQELSRGGTLAVFPEGTSYTMPRIVQVKEGAARAALGFARWGLEVGCNNSVSVVPVGIVYTDKSKYRSRLYIQYGEPIPLESFTERYLQSEADSEEERIAVRLLTAEIERELLRLTINAKDWETMYAAQTARSILWTDERNIPIEKFVDVSKSLIEIFDQAVLPDALSELKEILLRYNALQYYVGVTHSSLSHFPLRPTSAFESSKMTNNPHLSRGASDLKPAPRPISLSFFSLLSHLPSVLVPLGISFPTHLAYSPGYVFGTFAARWLAGKDEEARAQFKVVFGGFGSAIGTSAMGMSVWGTLKRMLLLPTVKENFAGKVTEVATRLLQSAISVFPFARQENVMVGWDKCLEIMTAAARMGIKSWANLGRMGDIIGAIGIAFMLSIWHARVIDGNYVRFKRLQTTFLVLRALLSPNSRLHVSNERLKPYLSMPPPSMNPYIAKSLQESNSVDLDAIKKREESGPANVDQGSKTAIAGQNTPLAEHQPIPVSRSSLVRYLLQERSVAVGTLREVFARTCNEISDNRDVVGTIDGLVGGKGGERQAADIGKAMALLRDCGASF
ncbi:hypothetical protein M0805_000501 [Coniferiporia weirii]|nr:hypothetical protein M0805_000501 [Coniferiporia weirii]